MGVKVKIDGVGVVEFDDKFKDLSKQEQQDLVNQVATGRRAGSVGKPQQNLTESDTEYLRSALQGILFGFGDEAEGLVFGLYDAATKGKSLGQAYKDARDNARKEIEQFRQDDPLAAYGTEVLASLPTALVGGAGLARAGVAAGKGLGAAVGRGAIEGAAYGLGAGEGDAVDQAASTLLGGATGAALTGAVGGVLRSTVGPAPTEPAQRLMKKGVTLTPAQQSPNSGIGFADLALGKLDPIRAAQRKAIPEFNRAAANEALEDIGEKVTRGAKGDTIITEMDDIFDAAYDKVLPDISLPSVDSVKAKINVVIGNVGRDKDAGKIMRDELRAIMDDFDLRGSRKQVDGQTFKQIESDMSRRVKELSDQYAKSGDRSVGRAAEGMKQSLQILRESVVGSTAGAKDRLQRINSSYGKAKIVEDAIGRGGAREFSPAQFEAAVKKPNKRQFARGQARLQDLSKDARAVLDPPRDSGTPQGLFGLAAFTNPSYAGSAAALPIISPMYRPLANTVLGLGRGTRALIEAGAPAVGGLLGSELARY
ncbi:hypothetical protein [uncultured Mediterranean phage uvMED]|nr:hypothetical protein [uncultured Mediterranean phage uvMED]